MKRILFIYGFNGSTESTFCRLIRKKLSQEGYEVLCPLYQQQDVYETKSFFEEYLEKEQIDVIVGSSFGAFIALCLNSSLPCVVINPCMKPSLELPLLKPRPDHPKDKAASGMMIEACRRIESAVGRGFFNTSERVIGLFAKDDKLLGEKYKDSFKIYYDNVRQIPGEHDGNEAAVPSICEAIKDVLKPILYIDMDNVLADFGKYVKECLPEELKDIEDKDEIPGIFAQFPVVEGAKEALLELQKEYELYVLSTSPWNNPTALQDKQNWLKLHFGNMFHKHVIFTHQKNLCRRPDAWLVDDRPNHGAYRFGDHWLHFGSEGKFKTWEDVRCYLMARKTDVI